MKVQRVPRVVVPEDVQLTLSDAEARVLLRVLNQVGGPRVGPRGITDDIAEGLNQIGVQQHAGPTQGSIYFQSLIA